VSRRVLLVAVLVGCRVAPPPSPQPLCSEPGCAWHSLAHLVDSAVADSAAPGAVVAVSARGRRFFHGSGRLGNGDATLPDSTTLYDLASLTKVVALTTGLMLAEQQGRLRLDDPVARYVQAFRGPGKERVTVRHLLTHSSGLPAHRPLWRQSPDWQAALALVDSTSLDSLPGTRTLYSDLGAIVLTQILEAVTGEPLDRWLTRRVFEPLGMRATRFLPPAEAGVRIAPTELDPWRGRVLQGEVHDENAWWLGGVSGHAGLFSNAADLLTFGEWLLQGLAPSRRGAGPLRPPGRLARWTAPQGVVPGASRALGWDTPSPGGSAGSRMSPRSFGHTGFTGTSIWIDPARELVVILLSNRVHPTRDNPRLGRLRPLVADCATALSDGISCVFDRGGWGF